MCNATTNAGVSYADYVNPRYGGYIESLGKFLVCGGHIIYCHSYDLATESWSRDGTLMMIRHEPAAVVIDNKMFITGGSQGPVVSKRSPFD